jgi:hypothetical protein
VPVAEVRIVFDQGAITLLARDDANVIAAMEYLSGKVLLEMKARGAGLPGIRPEGRDGGGRSPVHGDFPLRPSGYLLPQAAAAGRRGTSSGRPRTTRCT